ncbi:hypothetical protein [Solihabitans fulvus]|nr:hypothetical protein [Solihabitans fulvus]
MTLCGSSGLVALNGLARWRELAAIRPLPGRSPIHPPTALR